MVEPSPGSEPATQPATQPDSAGADRPKLPRWRRILVGVLVVLVCLLVPISVRGRLGPQHDPAHRSVRRHAGAALRRSCGAGGHRQPRHEHVARGDRPREARSPTACPPGPRRRRRSSPAVPRRWCATRPCASCSPTSSTTLWEQLLRTRTHPSRRRARRQGDRQRHDQERPGRRASRPGGGTGRQSAEQHRDQLLRQHRRNKRRSPDRALRVRGPPQGAGRGGVPRQDRELPAVRRPRSCSRSRYGSRATVAAPFCAPRSASRSGWRCCSRSSTSVARSISMRCRRSVRQDAASAVYDQVLSFLRTAVRTAFVRGDHRGDRGVARRPRPRGDTRARGGAPRADGRRRHAGRIVRRPLQERAAGPRGRGRARSCSSC